MKQDKKNKTTEEKSMADEFRATLHNPHLLHVWDYLEAHGKEITKESHDEGIFVVVLSDRAVSITQSSSLNGKQLLGLSSILETKGREIKKTVLAKIVEAAGDKEDEIERGQNV